MFPHLACTGQLSVRSAEAALRHCGVVECLRFSPVLRRHCCLPPTSARRPPDVRPSIGRGRGGVALRLDRRLAYQHGRGDKLRLLILLPHFPPQQAQLPPRGRHDLRNAALSIFGLAESSCACIAWAQKIARSLQRRRVSLSRFSWPYPFTHTDDDAQSSEACLLFSLTREDASRWREREMWRGLQSRRPPSTVFTLTRFRRWEERRGGFFSTRAHALG